MKSLKLRYFLISLLIVFFLGLNTSPFADTREGISKIRFIGGGSAWHFSMHTKDICGTKNFKLTFTWRLFNKYDLESHYLYLWEDIQMFEPDYYSAFTAHGLMFNLRFPLAQDINYGAGLGLFLANYVHPLIDTTYLSFTPGLYVKIEYLPYILDFLRIEMLYIFIPLDLRDYSYNKYAFMHIFTASIGMYGEKKDE